MESATLIQLNMTQQERPVWSNDSLPSLITPRANAEMIWMPLSEHGTLVAIGGVINPAFANINRTADLSTYTQNIKTSQTFMSTVSIYDISKQQWYEQATSGGPPGPLTQGCSVLASAEDGSSHNIYWYGGFNGYNITDFSDDVWVLSIPSFTWTKLYSGSPISARAGHVCARPYPDQIVIGGYTSLEEINTCLNDFARVFNLSSGTWLDGYDPDIWSNYSVPSEICEVIGGNGTGGANQTVPIPYGFTNLNLSSVFSEVYDTSKITTNYPYPSTSTSSILPSPVLMKKSSRKPKYLGPVLGVVLGLLFIIALLLVIWLWRRHLSCTREGSYTYTENDKMVDPFGGTRGKTAAEIDGNPRHEVGGTIIYEMMNSTNPAELDANSSSYATHSHPTKASTLGNNSHRKETEVPKHTRSIPQD